jgi:hypothetical protein
LGDLVGGIYPDHLDLLFLESMMREYTMFRFKNMTFKLRLTLLMLGISAISITLVSASFVFTDYQSFKQQVEADLRLQGAVLALSTQSAVLFDQPQIAQKKLFELGNDRDIFSARILGRDGSVFSSYLREDVQQEQLVSGGGSNIVATTTPIEQNGEVIGKLELVADIGPARVARLKTISTNGVIFVAFSFIISFILVNIMHRGISRAYEAGNIHATS